MSESRWSNVREICSSFCNGNVKNACPSRCVPECPEICQYSFIPSAVIASSAGNSSGVYKLDPFFIATLVCLAAGLFVACMYAIYLKYYSARGRRRQRPGREVHIVGQGQEHGHSESHSFGLEASIICAIKVHTYMEVDGPFEECAVCLNEFQEGEVLRILPKCDHAFHMTCVDVWLGSNISCPLCRARIVPHIDDDSPTSEDHTSPYL